MIDCKKVRFETLLTEPVRNGIYKKKEFHGRGIKIVNMGELFSYPRLRNVPMKRLELSESEKERFLIKEGIYFLHDGHWWLKELGSVL